MFCVKAVCLGKVITARMAATTKHAHDRKNRAM